MRVLDRIINKTTTDRKYKFMSLVHLVNAENLKSYFAKLKAGSASGVDFVTKQTYGQELDRNIEDLVCKLKSKQYRPEPVRRVYIPKAGSKENTWRFNLV